MKKIISCIAVFIVILVVATGFNQHPGLNKIAPGKKISPFEIENEVSRLSVGRHHDCYTLLILWASSDAPSRMACTEYTRLADSDPVISQNVRIAAINFDDNPTLFDEIIKTDSLDPNLQYRVDTERSLMLASMFELDRGYGTVLIAPDGTVVTFNPTPAYLRALHT